MQSLNAVLSFSPLYRKYLILWGAKCLITGPQFGSSQHLQGQKNGSLLLSRSKNGKNMSGGCVLVGSNSCVAYWWSFPTVVNISIVGCAALLTKSTFSLNFCNVHPWSVLQEPPQLQYQPLKAKALGAELCFMRDGQSFQVRNKSPHQILL